MFLYVLSPIDFDMQNLPLMSDVLQREAKAIPFGYDRVTDIISAWKLAQAAAEGIWEGDFRDGDGPRVMLLPSDGGTYMHIGFVWKQDNNGTTFAASPIKLPWLGKPDAVAA